MNRKIIAILTTLFIGLLLTACGEDPELAKFKVNFENFCINLSTLDTAINNIDAKSEDASDLLIIYMDQMDQQFQALAALEFPEEFKYLEELSDEASKYMSEAADSYAKAYANDTFDQAMSDYAYKNYKRAYKRIQLILIYLHGDEPREEDLISD